jgi:hypothetical protein
MRRTIMCRSGQQMRPPKKAGACGINVMIGRIANWIPSNEYQVPSGFHLIHPQAHHFT